MLLRNINLYLIIPTGIIRDRDTYKPHQMRNDVSVVWRTIYVEVG